DTTGVYVIGYQAHKFDSRGNELWSRQLNPTNSLVGASAAPVQLSFCASFPSSRHVHSECCPSRGNLTGFAFASYLLGIVASASPSDPQDSLSPAICSV